MRVYSAYWNAFECLVDAINLIKRQSKLSKSEKQSEKQKRIDEFIEARSNWLFLIFIEVTIIGIWSLFLIQSSKFPTLILKSWMPIPLTL